MHVVATNIILWIRTLIKETLEEISEIEEEHQKEEEAHLNITVWKQKHLRFFFLR